MFLCCCRCRVFSNQSKPTASKRDHAAIQNYNQLLCPHGTKGRSVSTQSYPITGTVHKLYPVIPTTYNSDNSEVV